MPTARAAPRGVQLANGRGDTEFATIYPGRYQGRALHIPVMVHIGGKVDQNKKSNTIERAVLPGVLDKRREGVKFYTAISH